MEPQFRTFRPLKQETVQEYLWYSEEEDLLFLLPVKPKPGREEFPHDLEVYREVEIMNIYYIGEF
jgi:hypothetical protein